MHSGLLMFCKITDLLAITDLKKLSSIQRQLLSTIAYRL